MADLLTSSRHEVADFAEAMEFPYKMGWSDGMPVVPPTEDRVNEFLEKNGLEPDQVIADITERDKVITAEKMAINSVMAGCLPEYVPVIATALEAMADPHFKFNHLASLGSPWPIIVVNGPIAKEIGMWTGTYLFGPGNRANLTIARAVSLTLRNCAGAKVEDVQRGQWGNGLRFSGCVGEIEDIGWEPLHVTKGFRPEQNAVTVASSYPGSPEHVYMNLYSEEPTRLLNSVCHAIAHFGGAEFSRGMYTCLMGPHLADIFIRAGWSKADVHDYIIENTYANVADLKFRGAWGKFREDCNDEMMKVLPGDENRKVYMFKMNEAEDPYMFLHNANELMEDRTIDINIVVAGGDAGARMQICIPYQVSTSAVTKEITIGRK